MLSAIENRMSSLLTKSEMGNDLMSWSRNVPGFRQLTFPYFTHPELPQPLLTIISLLLVERHVDQAPILILQRVEGQSVSVQSVEVLLGICRSASTQTLQASEDDMASITHLVVLRVPPFAVIVLRLPLFVLGHGVEAVLLLSLPYLDDRGDELDQKVRNLQQRGVEVIQEVDDQTFDMRTIVILIGHDHEVTVSQTVDRGVGLTVFQPENFLDVGQLDVFCDLIVTGFSHVKQFSTQGENTVVVSTDHSQTGDGESFGGVSFRKNQGTSLSVPSSRVVGIFQLDDTGNTAMSAHSLTQDYQPKSFISVGLLQDLVLLELGPAQDIVDDTRFSDCAYQPVAPEPAHRRIERTFLHKVLR
jgi:hypothetical protein